METAMIQSALFISYIDGERLTLGSLERQAESTSPHKLGKAAKGTGDTEDDGVVLKLGQAIVVEDTSRGSVDVRPGVLGLYTRP